ncbi:MAG: hypothetical protein V7724_02405 [Sediminicola sp.]|tara:strand:+ start:62630 stop:63079 length:450 start_codon:yes stop_codon:yes gene_type:complete
MNELLKYTALIALSMGCLVVSAQHKPDNDKIKALKIAFLTERLELSSSEAQRFWPIYNDHELKMDELRRKEWKHIRNKAKETESLTEKEANDLVCQFSHLEDEKTAENKRFLEAVRPILSGKKTLLLIKAEDDFKKQLFKEYWAKHREE